MQPQTLAVLDRAGDAIEGLGRFVGGVAQREHDAGVVEGHVEPAELGDRAIDEGGNLVLVGDVAGDAEGAGDRRRSAHRSRRAALPR